MQGAGSPWCPCFNWVNFIKWFKERMASARDLMELLPMNHSTKRNSWTKKNSFHKRNSYQWIILLLSRSSTGYFCILTKAAQINLTIESSANINHISQLTNMILFFTKLWLWLSSLNERTDLKIIIENRLKPMFCNTSPFSVQSRKYVQLL